MLRWSRHPRLIALLTFWPAVAAPPGWSTVSAAYAQDPSERAVSRQELEDLRRQIHQESRSSLEVLLDGHAESGDLNNKLGFVRYGGRLNLRLRPETTFSLMVLRAPYRTEGDLLESSATSLTAGARWKESERREWQLEMSGTRFDEEWSFTGLASLTMRPSEAFRYSLTLRRTNVEESLLSLAGLRPVVGPFAGQQVGRVHDNRLSISGAYRFPARIDVFGEAGFGSRSGDRVEGNSFRRAGGGMGFNAVARAEDEPLSLMRLSVLLDYFGFDDDRFGFGGASLIDARGRPVPPERLGSDGISPTPAPGNPGLGGYFSPNRFVSRVVRIDFRGRASTNVDYNASAFVGTQSFTGTDSRRAGGVSAGLTVRLGERLTLPAAYTWDDFGPFVQQSFVARLVLLF